VSTTIKLRLAEIPEPGAKGIQYATAQGEQAALLVRYAGEVRAYVNSCPHTGVTLNWADDQFFTLEEDYLQCSLHGALFQPLDGLCIHGPCCGESLKSLPVQLVEQYVLIYI
jgi:nitrite reductase/ring-hydroxylating ferredoxin subunit